MVEPEEIISKAKYLHFDETKKWLPISSVTGENTLQLKDLIYKMIQSEKPIIKKNSLKAELDKIYGN